MFTKEITSLLGLTRHEKSILEVLKDSSLNISRLSQKTRFPRTTLYTALTSLKKRGLITLSDNGKAKNVSLVDISKISHLFAETSTSFESDGHVRIAKKSKTGESSGFTLLHGKKSMVTVWEEVSRLKNERIYVIQPTRSILSSVKLFKAGKFVPINQAIRKNKVIIDAVMKEDGFATYMRMHAGEPHVQKKIIESFIGRSADMAMVKNEYLNNDTDLIITSKKAFLLNWENEVGIEIENKDMVNFLKELYLLTKGYGKKIDFNEYMREWLKRV